MNYRKSSLYHLFFCLNDNSCVYSFYFFIFSYILHHLRVVFLQDVGDHGLFQHPVFCCSKQLSILIQYIIVLPSTRTKSSGCITLILLISVFPASVIFSRPYFHIICSRKFSKVDVFFYLLM